MRSFVTGLGLILCLSACGGETEEQGAAVVATPTERVTPTPDAASRGKSAVSLALRSDGVTIIEAGSGSRKTNTIIFGADEVEVISAMSEVLGRPRTGSDAECGAGAVSFADFGSLQVNLRDGHFVGYVATMADGTQFAGVGGEDLSNATFEGLRNRADAEPVESTLDGEIAFSGSDGGRLGGFVEGAGESAPLQSVFAGTTCFYR
ncbi:hypothetical protein E3U23_04055 [Erythrobacter litoralis]|uniref:hypothetical protein n=1 Tax=Erythrobacter litoralis TaxID=39960 RepID=UPI00243592E9|nr:hypothetical protein [Erythrobacter litoralis]MDG6078364.1 hypothetical protein [Erythrobacter litoralis]